MPRSNPLPVPSTLSWRIAAVLVAAAPIAAPAAAAPARPNIVVILADDLGYGDVRCNNPERGKLPTPHLDRLAAEGMRFTDAHSSSGVCSPSRYTLLTGRYHWRTRLQKGIVGLWGRPLIAPDRLTIAELARRHGYRTAAVGKWHLGWDWPIDAEDRPHFEGLGGKAGGGGADLAVAVTPERQAAWRKTFSRPIPGGPTTRGFDEYFGTDVPNWPPYCFIENDRTVGIPTTLLPAEKLRKHQASLQGPALADWTLEPILPTLADRACAFLEKAGRSPQPFLLYLPLTSPHTPLAVNREWQGKSGLDNAAADLILETDAAVGRVLAALEKSGKARDTIVIFTSDNGFASYVGAKELEAKGHFPSGPLRGYKSDVYEGGHRVPFFVRWPGVAPAGKTCGQLVHHADLLPTLAEILGEKLPVDAAEDGFSLLPLLRGEDRAVREHAVSCAASGVPGVRLGSWKYIPVPAGEQPEQLYDLANDLGERRNLAAEHPERVRELASLYETLLKNGRSNPGPPQRNDVPPMRFPVRAKAPAGK